MADGVQVRAAGLRDLRRDLKRLDPAIDKELRDEIRKAAGKVALTAGALAPRRSGELQHSIRPFVSGARAMVGSTLPYAGVVHWGGTISPRGTPISFKRSGFITRAVEAHSDELVDDISDGIERAADRLGWKR